MTKNIYQIFAYEGTKDEHGLPKLYFRTEMMGKDFNWRLAVSFLRKCQNIEGIVADYKLPKKLKNDGLRELTQEEKTRWEYEIAKGDKT